MLCSQNKAPLQIKEASGALFMTKQEFHARNQKWPGETLSCASQVSAEGWERNKEAVLRLEALRFLHEGLGQAQTKSREGSTKQKVLSPLALGEHRLPPLGYWQLGEQGNGSWWQGEQGDQGDLPGHCGALYVPQSKLGQNTLR